MHANKTGVTDLIKSAPPSRLSQSSNYVSCVTRGDEGGYIKMK